MENLLWELFKRTGRIEYYMMIRKYKEERESDGNNKTRGNYNRGKEL